MDHSLPDSITITLDLEAERFELVLPEVKDSQYALMNLCINAADAMPDGGVLSIATSNRYQSSEDFELMNDYIYTDQAQYEEGDYLIITIKDTGCGMTQDIISNVFTPYFTTKESGRGAGLGMAAVIGTVSMHKGILALNSEVDKGTEVRLYLPLKK